MDKGNANAFPEKKKKYEQEMSIRHTCHSGVRICHYRNDCLKTGSVMWEKGINAENYYRRKDRTPQRHCDDKQCHF